MLDLISKLNEQQKEAVLTTQGPVMVMAGAGSGKTRVLTHRIAHLISNEGVYSSEILAVTFTNKAANEMKKRVSDLINNDLSRMWISTFHSICARILRFDIEHLGFYDSKFRILDTDDVVSIIKGIMKELDINSEELKPRTVASSISNMKNLENYDYPYKFKSKLIRIEEAYKEKLQKENLVDFDDLILLTLRLFEEVPIILQKYQNKFKYIMIDEFQDTNTSQYKLIKLLAQGHNNVFVVGDQDQSIYAFRGAVIENVEHFLTHFSDTKIILLEENYRSTSQILNLANNVISENKNRIKKNLFSQKDNGVLPKCIQVENQFDEARIVLKTIRELKEKGYENKDFAIIYRSNHLSRLFEDQLIRNNLPFVIYGGIGFYSRMEIKDVLAYISLVTNLDDNHSFLRIVNTPRRRIGDSLLDKLNEQTKIHNVSLFEAIDLLPTSGNKPLIDFKEMIISLKDSIINTSLEECIDLVLKKTGYEGYLSSQGDEGIPRLENVSELKSVIIEAKKSFDGNNLEILSQLISDIALRTNTDNVEEKDDKIKLTTYHQAKGLEFKVVFMVAMEDGIFPSSIADSDFELEEERRICYVGITRAEEKLFFTYTQTRVVFGQTRYSMISRFIKNSEYIDYDRQGVMTNNQPTHTTYTNPVIRKTLSNNETKTSPSVIYNQGDKVSHTVFGNGVVVKVNESNISIAFGVEYGVKILKPDIPALKKL